MLVLITIFTSARLRDSRLGRAWIAIREDEVAASAMGVPLMRTKTWAYATGAFFGGVAGAYYASYKSGAFPDDFFFNISVFILCMVILGGMGNIWGVIFGACFLSYLDREGLANVGAWINGHFDTHIDVPLYEFGIFGLILVVTMLFRPEGLIPSSETRSRAARGRARHAAVRPGDRMSDALLQTDRLRKEFGGLVAVDDVDFTVPRAPIVSLIGPNGAGKTTFFNMLTGVYKPTRGPGDLRRRGHDREAAARVHAARHRAHVPEHSPVPEHDGARERARRHARPPEGQPLRGAPAHAARAAARSRRRACARASCSSSPASGAATT